MNRSKRDLSLCIDRMLDQMVTFDVDGNLIELHSTYQATASANNKVIRLVNYPDELLESAK